MISFRIIWKYEKKSFKIQWIPLNVGTLGPALFAHIKRLPIKTEISKKKKKKIIIQKSFYFYYHITEKK